MRYLTIGVALALVCCPGCRSQAEQPETRKNLRAISAAYLQATDKLKRAPANLQELLPLLKEQGDPEKLLRSADDGEEFVIIWGVDQRLPPKGAVPVVAYEKKGQGGKRYVLRGRAVLHMRDDEFRQAPFPPGHRPPL